MVVTRFVGRLQTCCWRILRLCARVVGVDYRVESSPLHVLDWSAGRTGWASPDGENSRIG